MKPAMMDTIRDYDPSKPENPITKAWDATQNKVQIYLIKYELEL